MERLLISTFPGMQHSLKESRLIFGHPGSSLSPEPAHVPDSNEKSKEATPKQSSAPRNSADDPVAATKKEASNLAAPINKQGERMTGIQKFANTVKGLFGKGATAVEKTVKPVAGDAGAKTAEVLMTKEGDSELKKAFYKGAGKGVGEHIVSSTVNTAKDKFNSSVDFVASIGDKLGQGMASVKDKPGTIPAPGGKTIDISKGDIAKNIPQAKPDAAPKTPAAKQDAAPKAPQAKPTDEAKSKPKEVPQKPGEAPTVPPIKPIETTAAPTRSAETAGEKPKSSVELSADKVSGGITRLEDATQKYNDIQKKIDNKEIDPEEGKKQLQEARAEGIAAFAEIIQGIKEIIDLIFGKKDAKSNEGGKENAPGQSGSNQNRSPEGYVGNAIREGGARNTEQIRSTLIIQRTDAEGRLQKNDTEIKDINKENDDLKKDQTTLKGKKDSIEQKIRDTDDKKTKDTLMSELKEVDAALDAVEQKLAKNEARLQALEDDNREQEARVRGIDRALADVVAPLERVSSQLQRATGGSEAPQFVNNGTVNINIGGGFMKEILGGLGFKQDEKGNISVGGEKREKDTDKKAGAQPPSSEKPDSTSPAASKTQPAAIPTEAFTPIVKSEETSAKKKPESGYTPTQLHAGGL